MNLDNVIEKLNLRFPDLDIVDVKIHPSNAGSKLHEVVTKSGDKYSAHFSDTLESYYDKWSENECEGALTSMLSSLIEIKI
jgi:hypothetical protein